MEYYTLSEEGLKAAKLELPAALAEVARARIEANEMIRKAELRLFCARIVDVCKHEKIKDSGSACGYQWVKCEDCGFEWVD